MYHRGLKLTKIIWKYASTNTQAGIGKFINALTLHGKQPLLKCDQSKSHKSASTTKEASRQRYLVKPT